MASFIYINLDTVGPSNPSIVLAGGAAFATNQLVTAAIGTGDASTVGYQMKIWGDVDLAYDTNIQATEANSQWISFSATKQIKLSSGDGNKTAYLKLRDDVWNESSQVSDGISLNTAIPVVDAGAPDNAKVSLKSGKDVFSFTFSSALPFDEYKVKVVDSTGAIESQGTLVPTAGGSSNIAGVAGNYTNPITVTIKATDLQTAKAGEGQKIVKVFIKNSAGTWSV